MDLNQKRAIRIESEIRKYQFAALFFIVLGVVLAIPGLTFFFSSNDFELYEFGDYFGGIVGTLWSFAGIILIYVAFLGQKLQLLNQQTEIELNREELKATRIELEGQKQQMEEQNTLFRLQSFESTFFNLLSNFGRIVNEIDYHDLRFKTIEGMKSSFRENGGTASEFVVIKGRDALKKMLNYYKAQYAEFKAQGTFTDKQCIDFAFLKLLKEFAGDLPHYFENLVAIVKFVDSAQIINHEFYFSLIKAQISPIEWSLILYYTIYGSDKQWLEIANKHGLLINILPAILFEEDHLDIMLEKAARLKWDKE